MDEQPYGYIYLVRNKVNGKVYVGQTVQPVDKRWSQHIYAAYRRTHTVLGRAIKKHGRDAFTVLTLTTASDQVSLNLKERILIRGYRSMERDHGYNRTTGGSSGSPTAEIRARMSSAKLGKKQKPEDVAKRAATRVGQKLPAFSEQHKARIGAASKGRIPSAETRMKMSEAHRGRKISAGHAEILRNTWIGRKHTPEAKAKISQTRLAMFRKKTQETE